MPMPVPEDHPGWSAVHQIRDSVDTLRKDRSMYRGGDRAFRSIEDDLNKIRMLTDRVARKMKPVSSRTPVPA